MSIYDIVACGNCPAFPPAKAASLMVLPHVVLGFSLCLLPLHFIWNIFSHPYIPDILTIGIASHHFFYQRYYSFIYFSILSDQNSWVFKLFNSFYLAFIYFYMYLSWFLCPSFFCYSISSWSSPIFRFLVLAFCCFLYMELVLLRSLPVVHLLFNFRLYSASVVFYISKFLPFIPF